MSNETKATLVACVAFVVCAFVNAAEAAKHENPVLMVANLIIMLAFIAGGIRTLDKGSGNGWA